MLKKIVIASDFLMTKEKEQSSNRRWFKEILHRPIQRATGIVADSFASSLVNGELLSRKKFFELSGIEPDLNATQFWFDEKRINQDSLDYLSSFFDSDTLVVGYELSHQTRKLLEKLNVVYVDIWLHPIRFLDDILFGFMTNHQGIHAALAKYHLQDDTFFLYADRLKVQTYKGWRRNELELAPNSALFIGQTLEDKAVCRGGKMLTVLDFKKEFEAAGAQYSRVYYSRHPYVKKGDEEVIAYLKTLPFVEVVSHPAYQMLASNNLRKVISLSSSVVHEARYFGKQTEFLFRPVLQYGTQFSRQHVSIYQEFVSPSFWSDILKPVHETLDAPRVTFLDGKDKLRDMLAFYWSYGHIDKTEAMRQTLLAVDKKVSAALSDKTKTAANKKPAQAAQPVEQQTRPVLSDVTVLKKAGDLMDRHSVVSFDVFDTLLVRPFDTAEGVFNLIQPAMQDLSGGLIGDFRAARLAARKLATDRGLITGEEVRLADRYTALAESLGMGPNLAQKMLDIELAAELQVCQPRHLGKKLFDEAQRKGKRIVLVSDIYFDRDIMEALLAKAGYAGYERMFLSSEEGVLKHTGRIYPKVVAALGVTPADILHFGDNQKSDVDQAKASGLTPFYLEATAAAFGKSSKLAQAYNFSDALTKSTVRGIIANRLADNPWQMVTPSAAGTRAEDFGYAVTGPYYMGFAKWVLERAMEDKVDTLYFLARDGEIVKRCYDILAKQYPKAPKSEYVLASRRSLNVASLTELSQAIDMLKVNFAPTELLNLLTNRFGLNPEQIATEDLKAGGYGSLMDIADHKLHQGRLVKLITALWPKIELNATEERALITEYYESKNAFNPGNFAVVDIGHNGTLQISLSRLLNKELGGYYFVTYEGIAGVEKEGLEARGYLAERLNGKPSAHPYCNHLLMFELLFLNDQGSFVKFKRGKDGKPIAVHLPLTGEESRVSFSRKVHAGAEAFTQDLCDALGPDVERLQMDGYTAISGYLQVLDNPAEADAKLFEGLVFENMYSGRNVRMVLSNSESAAQFESESIWKEGAQVLLHRKMGKKAPITAAVTALVRRFSSEKRFRKFQQDPVRYFRESRFALLRPLAHLMKAA
jgi:predicted HAD superfamily hydrolase